eukprot:g1515.t1
MEALERRREAGELCALCHGPIVGGQCTRCGRVGGERFNPNAPVEREEAIDESSDSSGGEDDAKAAQKTLDKKAAASARQRADDLITSELAESLARLPNLDMADVLSAKRMEVDDDEMAMHFATKRQVVIGRRAEKLVDRVERRRAQTDSRSRLRSAASSSSPTRRSGGGDIANDPLFGFTRRAQRVDATGKPVDAGAWAQTDVQGRYHLTHMGGADGATIAHRDLVSGEPVERVPIAGSNVEVDLYRQDKTLDFTDSVDALAARAKHRHDAKSSKAASQQLFELQTDYDMRFQNRHKEIEALLDKKDAIQAAQHAVHEQALAQGAVQKAQGADSDAGRRELEELHGDVENGRLERLKLVLRMQNMTEEELVGMSEWERFQLKTAARRMQLYTIRNIDVADERSGNTALFKAVGRGNVDMVQLLLKYGANPSLLNKMGESPIHYAWRAWDTRRVGAAEKQVVSRNTFGVVRALVEGGCNVNVQDATHKNAALHLAAKFGPTDVVQYLLGRRASPELPDAQGRLPADVAAELRGKRAHAAESANLLTRWSAMTNCLKDAEFQTEWRRFLQDPNLTLIGETAAETVEALDNEQRKDRTVALARNGALKMAENPHSTAYDAPPAQQEADLQHENEVAHEKAKDGKLVTFRQRIAAGAKAERKLRIRLDDYIHRDADPGFVSRERAADIREQRLAQRGAGAGGAGKFARREQAANAAREKMERQRAAARAAENKMLLLREPLRARRLAAGREVLKDMHALGAAPSCGRPAVMSSIWRSGAANKHNQINKHAHTSANRARLAATASTDSGAALLGDDGAAGEFDVVHNVAPLNKEFALPRGKTHPQHFRKKGAGWVVPAGRRRPDYLGGRRRPSDPWQFNGSSYEPPFDAGVDGEGCISRLGIEGFDQLLGKDPFATVKYETKGTTLALTAEHQRLQG